MDWNTAIETNREALRRIMAVLVALAVLAERAGSRSLSVRWLTLSILRSAEAVAREFVVETTRTPQLSIEGPLEIRNTREDALLLASCFRALAAALGRLLSKTRRSPCWSAWMDSALCRFAPLPGRFSTPLGGWTPHPNDTS